jgi:aspartate/methionine/tyrosine aminotransferase
MTNDMLGVTTVPLQTTIDEGFLPSPARAAELITPNTRAIALVSPNNPVSRYTNEYIRYLNYSTSKTGATYPPSLLAEFATLCRNRNVALILDETYRDFITNGRPHDLFSPSMSTPLADPTYSESPTVPKGDWSWRSTLIHLFSFSKSYRMPGHRLGVLVGSPEFIHAANTVLDCLQICAPAPAQHALATPGLLPALRSVVRADAQELQQRHLAFSEALDGSWRLGTQGAYYAFVRHPFIGRGSREVCERLAREEGVVALPDDFFGNTSLGWIRFSVANVDVSGVTEAARRLAACTKTWGWKTE